MSWAAHARTQFAAFTPGASNYIAKASAGGFHLGLVLFPGAQPRIIAPHRSMRPGPGSIKPDRMNHRNLKMQLHREFQCRHVCPYICPQNTVMDYHREPPEPPAPR